MSDQEIRLIDANALYREVKTECNPYGKPTIGFDDGKKVLELIDAAPAIEATPVRHGRWIEKPPYKDETVKGLEFQIVCSECDQQNSSIIFDENSVPIGKTFYRSRYCPWCGAKMDKKDGGEEK